MAKTILLMTPRRLTECFYENGSRTSSRSREILNRLLKLTIFFFFFLNQLFWFQSNILSFQRDGIYGRHAFAHTVKGAMCSFI